jgi:hypothetical protein
MSVPAGSIGTCNARSLGTSNAFTLVQKIVQGYRVYCSNMNAGGCVMETPGGPLADAQPG